MKTEIEPRSSAKLATALAVLLFAVATGTASAAGTPEEQAITDSGPLVIEVVGQAKPNWGGTVGNKLLEAMEEAAGVDLEWEIPPTTSYTERLNVIMASGDLPDLMWSSIDESFWNWVESGLVLAVDEYLADAPHITEVVSNDVFNNVRWTEDGKLYGIARPMPVFVPGMFWRKDWLDRLGLALPTTIDEAVEAWRAIAQTDFDGNGKLDTYGFSMLPQISSVTNMLFPALGIHGIEQTGGEWLLDKDGNVTHLLLLDDYADGIAFLRDLYGEGVIEKEYILNKANKDIEQKMNQGLVGSMFSACHRASWTRIKQKTEEVFADAQVEFVPPLEGPGGQGAFVNTFNHWGVWFITTAAEDPEGIMQFLDLMHTKEWNFKQNTGIEGIHYESYDPETEVVTRTEEQAERWALDYNPRVWFTRRPDGEGGFYARAIDYKRTEFAETFAVNTDTDYYYRNVSGGYYPPAMRELDMNLPDWRQDLEEVQNKIIIGEAEMSELRDFIDRLYAAGLDTAIEEMQAYYDGMN
jgi:ABC-type glycerol-3-phosphate transport system substrate-binding protein